MRLITKLKSLLTHAPLRDENAALLGSVAALQSENAKVREGAVSKEQQTKCRVLAYAKYLNEKTVSWAIEVDFPRVPCVGEIVEFTRNADGTTVEGEPISSEVESVWWDASCGNATAYVFLEAFELCDSWNGKTDDWMEKQGWRLRFGGGA